MSLSPRTGKQPITLLLTISQLVNAPGWRRRHGPRSHAIENLLHANDAALHIFR